MYPVSHDDHTPYPNASEHSLCLGLKFLIPGERLIKDTWLKQK